MKQAAEVQMKFLVSIVFILLFCASYSYADKTLTIGKPVDPIAEISSRAHSTVMSIASRA